MKRYLTKSRFKLALECETKLFYTNKKEYCNQNVEDAFLMALAEGGFQVGELAKCYYPEGVMINEMDYETSVLKTNQLLTRENAIIFEAAVVFENLFARIDILKKNGNELHLIEVKSKSFGGLDQNHFLKKTSAEVATSWRPYIFDVAFQKLIMMKAFPDHKINSYLMLTDKNSVASVDGLNQFFKIVKENGRSSVMAATGIDDEKLGDKILIEVKVDDIIQNIYDGNDFSERDDMSFENWIFYLAKKYQNDEKITPILTKNCKACEFHCNDSNSDKKSGFKECWSEVLGWKENDFQKPSMLDVWNFSKKNELLDQGKFFMEDLSENDIEVRPTADNCLSNTERQWLQIEKTRSNDTSPYLNIEGLRAEVESWKFPLHFIDFETTSVAIPFYKGFHPYEGVAFQFSHHKVDADGCISHEGEYINIEKGKFPNFEFIRALKIQLENDEGTIFRYHNHENTYLNMIYNQLLGSSNNDVPDKLELMTFIRSITYYKDDKGNKIHGPRDMVDLYQVVKKYYYHIDMGGSISLKYVLPAVLNSSKYLQEKYSKPIYGSNKGLSSINYTDWTWIQFDVKGKVKNPYDTLPSLFPDLTEEQLTNLMTDKNYLKEGGSAMMAYARMQFSEMKDYEFEDLKNGLLRYCELDTFAMVLVWEYFNHRLSEYS